MAGSLQIGIFADNLRLPLRDGIVKAAELGVASFQMFTTRGDALPENMPSTQRADLRRYYEGLGLSLSATCADFGGFDDPVKNERLVPHMFEQIDLAVELGTNIITTHIGLIPDEPDATWDTIRHALDHIGIYAEKQGLSSPPRPDRKAVQHCVPSWKP